MGMPHAQRVESWKMGWELNNLDKILTGDELTSSGQSNSEIIEALRKVSPEVFTDGEIDFELLRNILGISTEESDERFGLNSKGKRKALQLTRTSSLGTLRPRIDEFEGVESQNLIIEGDNIEVLKLLTKSYAGMVKMIYIDPPYNSDGSDIYEDDFIDPIGVYYKRSGLVDAEGKIKSTNAESSGRYHTTWLNHIYPRLILASQLLHESGMIFISLDDSEHAHMRILCNDIFGRENFVGNFIWEKRTNRENRKEISTRHDYVLCFRKGTSETKCELNQIILDEEYINANYSNPDDDPMGLWKSDPAHAQAGHATKTQLYDFKYNGKTYKLPSGRCWVFTKDVMKQKADENKIWFGKEGKNSSPRIKTYANYDYQGEEIIRTMPPETILFAKEVGTNEIAKNNLKQLFSNTMVFDTPKPVELLKKLLAMGTDEDCIVLDFYAGSGTLGHSVIEHSMENSNTNVKYIMVQEHFKLDSNNKDHRPPTDLLTKINKPHFLSEITKERMRRVAAKIKEENQDYQGDLGFKVFKLDTSNIKEWDGGSEDLHKSLEDYVNQIKDDRTSMDILYEVMLKSGIQLTAEIEEIEVGDNKILSVDNCRLLTCLDKEINSDAVAEIASVMVDLKKANPDAECMVLFLDSAFADSSGKLNMSETLKQNGFGNIRSI